MANKQSPQTDNGRNQNQRSSGNNGQKGGNGNSRQTEGIVQPAGNSSKGNSHKTNDMGKTTGDQRKEGGAQQAAERRDDRNGSTGGAIRSGR
ncbi:MAG: hypothetical protein JWP69_2429 [Flaviaesturariibacter sp.]|nr:hypothetical protein [Flaviaesturariibacter sp.]